MKIKPIRIGRFLLTKMTASDGEKYHQLSDDEEVMKYVTGYALNRQESDKMLSVMLAEHGDDTYLGRYFIEESETGELIGAAKLDQLGSEIEIGYRIQKAHWHKGIATEIAEGLIRFSRGTLNAKTVIAFVNVDNAPSIRVLEKAGMKNVQTIEDIDEVKYKFIHSTQPQSAIGKAFHSFFKWFN